MREMLSLQPRFTQMHGRRAINLLDHRRFRAAYDFMVLLSEAGEVDEAIATFWTDVQGQTEEQRAVSFQLAAGPKSKGRPRKRRKRKSGAAKPS